MSTKLLQVRDLHVTVADESTAEPTEILRGVDLGWNGAHRFIPYLLMKHGCRVAELEVVHHARRYGQSKYKPTKIFKTVKDFLKLIILRMILGSKLIQILTALSM